MNRKGLVLMGYGRMGRAVEALARGAQWEITAVLDGSQDVAAAGDALAAASVAIDFSVPEAAVPNIRAAVAANCPIVVGTTGWYEHLPEVTRFVIERGGRMLWAPNFSIGAQMMMALSAEAGRMVRELSGFDMHLLEVHHSAKKDVPSGTAQVMAARAGKALGRQVPVTSIRTGSEPGRHELILDGEFESIRIVHEARDRRVFASGALKAAEWLASVQGNGVFTLQDLLQQKGREG